MYLQWLIMFKVETHLERCYLGSVWSSALCFVLGMHRLLLSGDRY